MSIKVFYRASQESFLDQTVEYDGKSRRIEKVETNSGQPKVPG